MEPGEFPYVTPEAISLERACGFPCCKLIAADLMISLLESEIDVRKS